MPRFLFRCAVACAYLLFASVTFAGPVVISATDIDDHGSATASLNLEGWLFLQRALEAVAAHVQNGHKVVVCLGCNSQVAANAFNSAFDKSSLPAAGWTRHTLTTAAELTGFFSATSTAGVPSLLTTGIVYMPSDRVNALGGLTEAQLEVINANHEVLAKHVATGGGLVALLQSSVPNGYGWLKSGIPGLIVDTGGISVGRALTAAQRMTTDFPNLDLSLLGSASHAHAHFRGNVGGLLPLAYAPAGSGSGQEIDGSKSNHDIVVLLGGANVAFSVAAHGVPVYHPLGWLLTITLVALLARLRGRLCLVP